jgi:endonuclease/exonuclease/phosphatase (EEP) superfamily protein YafD
LTRLLLRWAALALLLASAVAFLAPWNWFADLLVNFRVQYVFLGALLAAILAILRDWRAAAGAALAGLLSVPAAWALVVPAELPLATPTVRLSVASANVFFMNDKHAAVLAWARRRPADVIVFIEVTEVWAKSLRELTKDYPYTVRTAAARIAVLSRLPLEPALEVRAQTGGIFALRTGLRAGGQRIDVLAVHCSWPLRPALALRRARQLSAIAQLVRGAQRPMLVIGDYNASPLSAVFSDMLTAGGLHSAASGRGWQPTWPSFLPPLGIQIDHVLANNRLRFAAFRTETLPGSDHRAAIAGVYF